MYGKEAKNAEREGLERNFSPPPGRLSPPPEDISKQNSPPPGRNPETATENKPTLQGLIYLTYHSSLRLTYLNLTEPTKVNLPDLTNV